MAYEKRLIDANEVEEMAGAFAGQAATKDAYAAFWKVIHNIRQMLLWMPWKWCMSGAGSVKITIDLWRLCAICRMTMVIQQLFQ